MQIAKLLLYNMIVLKIFPLSDLFLFNWTNVFDLIVGRSLPSFVLGVFCLLLELRSFLFFAFGSIAGTNLCYNVECTWLLALKWVGLSSGI